MDCITAVPTHALWYTFLHSRIKPSECEGVEVKEGKNEDPTIKGTDDATVFPGRYADNPTAVSDYDLVFPNGCRMGENLKGQQDMLKVFRPKVYIGFVRTDPPPLSIERLADLTPSVGADYAEILFNRLNEIDKDTKKPFTFEKARKFADEKLAADHVGAFKTAPPFYGGSGDLSKLILDLKP